MLFIWERAGMSGKGTMAQKAYNDRAKRIREGKEQPREYTTTLEDALKAAGL
jgi:hypothetical protein